MVNLGDKLLQMTKGKMRLTLADVQSEVGTENFEEQVNALKREGLVNANHDFLEVSSRQRVLLAESLVRAGKDPQQVSRLLAWQEFEEFVEAALDESGYRSVRHVIFKGTAGRREIDVLAWNDVWILVVDCKHWSGPLALSRMKTAAQAQTERVRSLAERPETMQRQGIRRLDLPLVPVLLTLGEPRDRLIGGVPIVGLVRLSSFLQEASPYVYGFLTINVQARSKQTSLTDHIHHQKRNRMPNLTQDAERRRP